MKVVRVWERAARPAVSRIDAMLDILGLPSCQNLVITLECDGLLPC